MAEPISTCCRTSALYPALNWVTSRLRAIPMLEDMRYSLRFWPRSLPVERCRHLELQTARNLHRCKADDHGYRFSSVHNLWLGRSVGLKPRPLAGLALECAAVGQHCFSGFPRA